MTGVKLICAGKLKEDFYLKACQEYQKRLSSFCRLEVLEIPEDTRPGGLEREGEKILAAIPPQSYVVAMCIEGEKMSSRELSRKMEKWKNSGISRLCFVIGSSEGLSDKVKKRAGLRLSMSPMTFPHHLARVMVLEQIYRAFSISAGSKYHK